MSCDRRVGRCRVSNGVPLWLPSAASGGGASFFLACSALFVAANCSIADESPSGNELGRKVVESRNAIQSGTITLSVTRRSGLALQSISSSIVIVTFNETSFACKTWLLDAVPSDVVSPPNRPADIKYIRTDHEVLFHVDAGSTADDRTAAIIGDADKMENYVGYSFEPKLLGMVPSPTTFLYGIDFGAFAEGNDRRWTRVEESDLNGKLVWFCEYLRNDGYTGRMWISPSDGWSILKAEGQVAHGNDEVIVDSISVTPGSWHAGMESIAFPARVQFKRELSGKVGWQEDVNVISARFNFDIDEVVFGPAALDLPVGNSVMLRTDEPSYGMIWDGKELKVVGAYVEPEKRADPVRGPERKRFLWILCGNAAALAIIIIFMLWLKRRKAA